MVCRHRLCQQVLLGLCGNRLCLGLPDERGQTLSLQLTVLDYTHSLRLQARFTPDYFFFISGTPWESNVCTAISGTTGSSRCCTDWTSWSLASDGTSIEVWSCIKSCCVCRVSRHSAHSRLASRSLTTPDGPRMLF